MKIINNGKDQVVEEGANVMPAKTPPQPIDQRKLVFGHLNSDMGGKFAESDEAGAVSSDGGALYNPGCKDSKSSKVTNY